MTDPFPPGPRRNPRPGRQAEVLAVISLGGVLGALARYGIGQLLPDTPGGFPLATFGINVLGCLLIGGLLVLLTEIWAGHRLLRPLLGTGILGGFTTFSTYVVDVHRLIANGHPATAMLYLGGTLLAALAAVWLGVVLVRVAMTSRRGDGE